MMHNVRAGDDVQYRAANQWSSGYTVIQLLPRDASGAPRVLLRDNSASTAHSDHRIDAPATRVRIPVLFPDTGA